MDIKRAGTRPTDPGSADYFTGAVRIERLLQAAPPARFLGGDIRQRHQAEQRPRLVVDDAVIARGDDKPATRHVYRRQYEKCCK